MKTTLSFQLNTATWIVTVLALLVALVESPSAEQTAALVLATFIWMAVYYLFFKLIAPTFLLQGKFIAFFSVSAVILLVLPFFGYSILLFSKALFTGNFSDFYGIYSFKMHMSGFKAMEMAGVCGSFFRLIAEHFSN